MNTLLWYLSDAVMEGKGNARRYAVRESRIKKGCGEGYSLMDGKGFGSGIGYIGGDGYSGGCGYVFVDGDYTSSRLKCF